MITKTTKIFGILEIDPSDGLFIDKVITLNGKTFECNLYISEDFIERQEKSLDRVIEMLDNLDNFEKRARTQLIEEQHSNGLIKSFITFHFDELSEEMKESVSSEIMPENFLDFIKLSSVNIHTDAEEAFIFQLDFCINPEISDELLVVNFGSDGEILRILHES